MISEGVEAPVFELPAVVDGEVTVVDLGESIGDEIVVLAFYPADFSPACSESASDLREFELFTMQKDVEAFAISPDSVYSHRGFARHYDLTLPLLADPDRDLAAEYDLHFRDEYGQGLIRRAVAVIDHTGVIRYTWSADDMTTTPDVDAVRSAIGDIASDPTALARYRLGHAHYVEGRRAFTSAMAQHEDSEWNLAQGDFEQAFAEFDEAASQFDSTIRFADDGEFGHIGELSKEKANALKRAAEWLGKSANAFSNGQGELAQGYQADAEQPLSTAREISEPPEPASIGIDADGNAEVSETMERTEVDDTPAWATEDTPDVEQSEVDAIEQAVAAAEEEMDTDTEDDENDAEPDDRADGVALDTEDDGNADGTDDTTADPADGADDTTADEDIPEEIDLAEPDPQTDEGESSGMDVLQPTDRIDVKREQSGPTDDLSTGGTAGDGRLAPEEDDDPLEPGGDGDPLAPDETDASAGDGDADPLAEDGSLPADGDGDAEEEAAESDDGGEETGDEEATEADDDEPIELDLTDPNED